MSLRQLYYQPCSACKGHHEWQLNRSVHEYHTAMLKPRGICVSPSNQRVAIRSSHTQHSSSVSKDATSSKHSLVTKKQQMRKSFSIKEALEFGTTHPLERLVARAIFDRRVITSLAIDGSLVGSLLCLFKGCGSVLESLSTYLHATAQGLSTIEFVFLLVEAVGMARMRNGQGNMQHNESPPKPTRGEKEIIARRLSVSKERRRKGEKEKEIYDKRRTRLSRQTKQIMGISNTKNRRELSNESYNNPKGSNDGPIPRIKELISTLTPDDRHELVTEILLAGLGTYQSNIHALPRSQILKYNDHGHSLRLGQESYMSRVEQPSPPLSRSHNTRGAPRSSYDHPSTSSSHKSHDMSSSSSLRHRTHDESSTSSRHSTHDYPREAQGVGEIITPYDIDINGSIIEDNRGRAILNRMRDLLSLEFKHILKDWRLQSKTKKQRILVTLHHEFPCPKELQFDTKWMLQKMCITLKHRKSMIRKAAKKPNAIKPAHVSKRDWKQAVEEFQTKKNQQQQDVALARHESISQFHLEIFDDKAPFYTFFDHAFGRNQTKEECIYAYTYDAGPLWTWLQDNGVQMMADFDVLGIERALKDALREGDGEKEQGDEDEVMVVEKEEGEDEEDGNVGMHYKGGSEDVTEWHDAWSKGDNLGVIDDQYVADQDIWGGKWKFALWALSHFKGVDYSKSGRPK